MRAAERNTGEEGPLFADEPGVVLDIVRVCQDGVEAEKGKAVEMVVPGDANVEAGPLDLLRANSNRSPVHILKLEVTETNATYMTMT